MHPENGKVLPEVFSMRLEDRRVLPNVLKIHLRNNHQSFENPILENHAMTIGFSC